MDTVIIQKWAPKVGLNEANEARPEGPPDLVLPADAHSLVVVDDTDVWPAMADGVEVMSAWRYLKHEWTENHEGLRVYNLCHTLAYQSAGYYVSLLAQTHGHKVLPDAATTQDLQAATRTESRKRQIERLAARCLGADADSPRVVTVYFGVTAEPGLLPLGGLLHQFFPCPLLRATFVPSGQTWRLSACEAMALSDVPAAERPSMYEAAKACFNRYPSRVSRPRPPASVRTKYEMAVLVNDADPESPSDPVALGYFQQAAAERDMRVRFVGKEDVRHILKHDALFIRETTAVNHHTYEIARMAERAGLVVIDDSESILRCTNKVFLSQLMLQHGIAQPDTVVIHAGNLGCVRHLIGFPCVIKRPDSHFSRGVVKVHDEDELHHVSTGMFRESDLLIAQRYEYTPFDWRIGVMDGVPLFACRYYMARNHWQVVKRDEQGNKQEGAHDTLAIEHAPASVVRVALAAANAVGRGLYGVDLKQNGSVAKVIEVNDNPSIDHGIEDAVLGMDLYRRIIGSFVNRLNSTHSLHEDRA